MDALEENTILRAALAETKRHKTPIGLRLRKNFLFLGSDASGERAAVIYTVLQSAKLNGLDPEAYLARCHRPLWPRGIPSTG